MKNLILTLALSGILFSSINASNVPAGIKLQDESYVADIPFNTESIFRLHIKDPFQLKSILLKEEAYVNDIPFNTEEIAKNLQDTLKTVVTNPQLQDEEYVDDIPFDTREIAKSSR